MRIPLNAKEKALLTTIKRIYDDFRFEKTGTATYEILKEGKVIAAHTITTFAKPILMKAVLRLKKIYVETIQSVEEANNHLSITLNPLSEKEEKQVLTIIKSIYDNLANKTTEMYTYEILKEGQVIAAHAISGSNKPLLMQVVQALCQKYVETIQSVKEENNDLSITLKPLSEKEKKYVKVIESILTLKD